MGLRVTDRDGQQYIFDDSQAAFIKRLVQENIELGCRVMELETEVAILQVKLQASQQKNDEIVLAAISLLDPEKK